MQTIKRTRTRLQAWWAWVIVASLLASPILVGCQSWDTPQQANYTIDLTESASGAVVVTAAFRGWPSGDLVLAMPASWSGYQGLDQQIEWLRLGGVQGGDILDAGVAQQTELSQDLILWKAKVPMSGRLEVAYRVKPNGEDGPVPSRVNEEGAMLLSRSFLALPLETVATPKADLAGVYRVTVTVPKSWRAYTSWAEAGGAFVPSTAEALWDGALVVGDYEPYTIDEDGLTTQVLLDKRSSMRMDPGFVDDLGQRLADVWRLFEMSPRGAPQMALTTVVLSTEDAAAEPRTDVVGDGLLLGEGVDSAQLAPELALAMTKLWCGQAIRDTPCWCDTSVSVATWLYGGWGEYLLLRAPEERGGVASVAFWTAMRDLQGQLDRDTLARSMSLQEAAARAVSSADAANLARAKALFGAAVLDEKLRQASEGAVDLQDLVKSLLRERNYYTQSATTHLVDVEDMLTRLSGANLSATLEEIALGVGSVDAQGIAQLSGLSGGETRALVTTDGYRLAYQWFDGPSERVGIYLSAGPGTPPYAFMRAGAAALRPNIDMAYLDQRGSGRSDRPSSDAYALDAFVDDIETLRDALGAERVTLIGNQWGGYCAVEYARRYPERVQALVLLSPVLSYREHMLAALAAIGESTTGVGSSVGEEAARLGQTGVTTMADFVMVNDLLRMTASYGSEWTAFGDANQNAYQAWVREALLPAGIGLTNESIWPALVAKDRLLEDTWVAPGAGFEAAILTVMGEDDNVTTSQARTLIGMGGVRLLPGAGREVFVDAPEMTLTAISRFVQELP